MVKLISHKVDSRAKKIIRNREGHYVMIKGQPRKKAILNVHAPNNRTAEYKKENWQNKSLNRQILIIVGDFNTSLINWLNVRVEKQFYGKKINNAINQQNLINMYRYAIQQQTTHFQVPLECMPRYTIPQTNLSKCKRNEIILCVLPPQWTQTRY